MMKYYTTDTNRTYTLFDVRRIYRNTNTAGKPFDKWFQEQLDLGKLVEHDIADECRKCKSHNTVVINLYGGPGAGKSTLAHRLVAQLAMDGYLSEYVAEYAKELIYEGKRELLDGTVANQTQVTAQQQHRIERLMGTVEIIVTDSPSLLGLVYADHNDSGYTEFEAALTAWDKTIPSINVFVNREGIPYDNRNRRHNEEQSRNVDNYLKDRLTFIGDAAVFKRFSNGRDNFAELVEMIEARAHANRLTALLGS